MVPKPAQMIAQVTGTAPKLGSAIASLVMLDLRARIGCVPMTAAAMVFVIPRPRVNAILATQALIVPCALVIKIAVVVGTATMVPVIAFLALRAPTAIWLHAQMTVHIMATVLMANVNASQAGRAVIAPCAPVQTTALTMVHA